MSTPGHPGEGDWMACGVCARVLDKYDQYEGGKLVGVRWQHTEVDKSRGADEDHPVVPIHYSQMAEIKTVCDFCSTPGGSWELPVKSFVMTIPGRMDPWGSTASWLACDQCAELINRGLWPQVSRRGAESVAAINGTRPEDELPMVRAKHRLVRKYQYGPLRRVNSGAS